MFCAPPLHLPWYYLPKERVVNGASDGAIIQYTACVFFSQETAAGQFFCILAVVWPRVKWPILVWVCVNIGRTYFVCIPYKVKVMSRAVVMVWDMLLGVRMT
jgi:hypothetical protein